MKKVNDLKILLVEDEMTSRATLRAMLSEMGVTQVFEAKDGQTAKELIDLDAGMIDLIVCDWNMPNLSGIDLLKHIRSRHMAIPFLMVTGRNDIASVMTAKETGVSGYIRKPFSVKELDVKIKQAANIA